MTDTLQDTIEFAVQAEKTVINDTIKVTTTVTALVGVGIGERSEDDPPEEDILRAEIRAMLRRLIDADWQFTNMQRSVDATGVECLSLVASTRVGERENHSLEDRALAVSRKGLKINPPLVDTSIPAALIEQTERELRQMILTKVVDEAKALSDTSGRRYRVMRLQFGSTAPGAIRPKASMMRASGAMASASYGSGFDSDDPDSLGNAQKLVMTGSVVLATPANQG